ncbi:MAG: hypothetical protein R3F61_11365 [Myxococcota bacterium]
MFGVYAAVLVVLGAEPPAGDVPAKAAQGWDMAVGRLEKPVSVRLADGVPALGAVVESEKPVKVAYVRSPDGEIPVWCGHDVRFRCFALAAEGPLELCAGPGNAPCLDGAPLEIPRRVEVLPHRTTSMVPEACRVPLDEARDRVRERVRAVLEGSASPMLLEERGALAAPRLHDACTGWYGTSGYDYNRAWCELQAAEHVALFARTTGSTEGIQPVLDALIADCCVGNACPVGPFEPPVKEPAE